MEIFVFWMIFSIIAGIIASNKGRSGFGFFLLSVLLSPLIGIIFALVVQSRITQPVDASPTPETHVRCPDCKELIMKDARVCKHCGCKLTGEQVDANQQKKCIRCGSMNNNEKSVCHSCGSVI
ncbi:double zinc ribbon domain-containing protein [Malikia spinosa]|uniref:double zinc ribbon domain-containing protein n=1 Tax=Malikia spinosa TaxID=86180 RepID=UPI002FDA5747